MFNTKILNTLWLARCFPDYLSFQSACKDVKAIQTITLMKLLSLNESSAYGQKYGFSKVKDVRQFQNSIPIVSYDEIEPWVERIRDGEKRVLTCEKILRFEKTSGSSSASKLVPYTASLLREFQRAIHTWIYDLYSNRQGLGSGRAYWCISPLSEGFESRTEKVPIGTANDHEYFSSFERALFRRVSVLPDCVSQINDLESCLYVTLRLLIQSPDLSLISVWSPSFLSMLLERLQNNMGQLLSDLETGEISPPKSLSPEVRSALQSRLRANPHASNHLRSILRRTGKIKHADIWPSLKVISCWTEGSAHPALPSLRNSFSDVEIQGKGLMATEGIVTIPLTACRGSVLAAGSHFYEFIENEGERPKLAHELELGQEYSVLLTTGGGLWRYRLGDRVKVNGYHKSVPVLGFMGKSDGVVDLCGEKLNPIFVEKVINRLRISGAWSGNFAMLAPIDGTPFRYCLFVEGKMDSQRLNDLLDLFLRENPHYDYCRNLGQLNHPLLFQITENANEIYLRRSKTSGQRISCTKPVSLHSKGGWENFFQGSFVTADSEDLVLG